MHKKLKELVNSAEWELAEAELERITNNVWDDELATLAFVIHWYKEDYAQAYECIIRGLEYDFKNYELYFLLGNYYERINLEQAWLCYENAEFFCKEKEDLKLILEAKNRLEQEGVKVPKVAIVILTYNLLDITKKCLESIRENNLASSYELILVDNHSTDGTREWLSKLQDIKLINNDENKGFPYGCNQGIKAAESEADILLLNNDTVVTPNALFWLRMGLYEKKNVGATGSVTNFAGNDQVIESRYSSVEEYLKFAENNNIPMLNPYEKKSYLIGFAMLLKRKALDEIGLLDVRFSPGMWEDTDIGLRLQYSSWQVVLCRNSFIYHFGSGNGKNLDSWKHLYATNGDKINKKWKFDVRYYTCVRTELINLIERKYDEPIRVLEIGCGMGATLAKIQYLWRNAEVKGIELLEKLVEIGANSLDIIQGDIENMEIPYEKGYFDYIIMGDVLEHLKEPEKVLKSMTDYLKPKGEFVCSIQNVMHMSFIVPFLKGEFDCLDSRILGGTQKNFFALDSIFLLFARCNLNVEKVSGTLDMNFHTEENMRIIEGLSKIDGIAPKELFEVYQYIFKAKRK